MTRTARQTADRVTPREPSPLGRSCLAMRELGYYREQAAHARRLANSINHPEARNALLAMAKDYDELAVDLERGAIDVRHPELMPQRMERRTGR